MRPFPEEFGLAGNLFLIVCFLLLIWRGLATLPLGAGTLFSRLIAGRIVFSYDFGIHRYAFVIPLVEPLSANGRGMGLALGILMSVARAATFVSQSRAPL